ncbi:hypothetical protein CH63R_14536 [Colletotrichum higginsianum IMI 349063]|uniref:Uncharacterized protein n=1 Tax=Colletotrichum higginsianum (strain IMI 349063) TaxID=759273 RepID=A0A1B7XQF7_COLHI|nr:hypothetical protein CH63R_14536 [Colletotrichum higginsianum IMI 349063]OBR01964.1 hypothetical protein CH63R_14536 [Colletotrichum higginsianum IMI 349063]
MTDGTYSPRVVSEIAYISPPTLQALEDKCVQRNTLLRGVVDDSHSLYSRPESPPRLFGNGGKESRFDNDEPEFFIGWDCDIWPGASDEKPPQRVEIDLGVGDEDFHSDNDELGYLGRWT